MIVDLLDPALRVAGLAHQRAAELRARLGPVSWQPARAPGFWAVLGWREAREVLARPERFTSTRGTRPCMQRPAGASLPLHNLDPPEHTRVRREFRDLLVRPGHAASPPAAPIEEELDAVARALVRSLVGRVFDGVEALALPLATRALARALDVELDVARELARASLEAHAAAGLVLERYPHVDPAEQRAAKRASARLFERVAEITTSARARGVARARARQLLQLVVQAGLVTAVDGLSGALALLAAHAPSPSDAPLAVAVEELLRMVSPINQFARTAARDCELGGQRVAAGQQVVVFFAAANRDPREFADPDRLILDRAPNRHLAFGLGPHACPGASLSRAQLRAVLRALRREGLTPTPAGAGARRRSAFLNGYDRLPLRWRPAQARGAS